MTKTYVILFTYEDGDPGVRLIKNATEQEADDYLQKVQRLYDDPEARLIEWFDSNDDRSAIDEAIAALEEDEHKG